MRLEDVVFGWTPQHWDRHPTVGQVDVGLVGDCQWTSKFIRTDGRLFPNWPMRLDRERYMFQLFNLIVVADAIDPQVAHNAFLKIDEYRWGILRDVPGYEERP